MNRDTSTAGRILAVTLTLVLSCGAVSSDAQVPPDESLTIAEYIRLGMPDPRSDWTKEDRSAARSILRELAGKNPTQLPRFGSAHSGVLFERLVHEEVYRRDALEGEVGDLTGREFDRLRPD